MNKRLKKIFSENNFEKKFSIDEAVELARKGKLPRSAWTP